MSDEEKRDAYQDWVGLPTCNPWPQKDKDGNIYYCDKKIFEADGTIIMKSPFKKKPPTPKEEEKMKENLYTLYRISNNFSKSDFLAIHSTATEIVKALRKDDPELEIPSDDEVDEEGNYWMTPKRYATPGGHTMAQKDMNEWSKQALKNIGNMLNQGEKNMKEPTYIVVSGDKRTKPVIIAGVTAKDAIKAIEEDSQLEDTAEVVAVAQARASISDEPETVRETPLSEKEIAIQSAFSQALTGTEISSPHVEQTIKAQTDRTTRDMQQEIGEMGEILIERIKRMADALNLQILELARQRVRRNIPGPQNEILIPVFNVLSRVEIAQVIEEDFDATINVINEAITVLKNTVSGSVNNMLEVEFTNSAKRVGHALVNQIPKLKKEEGTNA